MNIPDELKNTGLFRRLSDDSELLNSVLSMRRNAEYWAATISRTAPSFTDHTIRHMDALWGVTDQVLLEDEVNSLTVGEAFLLSSSFYLHDIGMAYAATDEGMERIKSSKDYRSFVVGFPESNPNDPSFIAAALSFAIRRNHASAAIELATNPIPGTEHFLIESHTIRESWGKICGNVAASHHWNLEKIEHEFGSTGVVPLPHQNKGDLGFVAAILRIVDYAHINRDRAPSIERTLRGNINPDSLIHWLAQENIDGPLRDGGELVYHAAAAIKDVDAWWLYFETLKGLDSEIRAVRRYLDRRSTSPGRFSLQGVRGVESPQDISTLIPTNGFLPIEINLRTGSVDRLVHLLAGESLYGPDPMAAVRELIQNARDAVMLKAATANDEFTIKTLSVIPIRLVLKTTVSPPILEVKDSGIGMSNKVMSEFLISLASDYWTSQYAFDFPAATEKRFQPAGRFGIGFLSVFMLGDRIVVESNRDGGQRYRLQLRGIARRGELRSADSCPGSGTIVRIDLKDNIAKKLSLLPELARIYAPVLPHSLEVIVDGDCTEIPEGWIFEEDVIEFYRWILKAVRILSLNRSGDGDEPLEQMIWRLDMQIRRRRSIDESSKCIWIGKWPEYREGGVRLVAAFEGVSLLSLKGLAVQSMFTPGFCGIIDLNSGSPDVSRQRIMNADINGIIERAILSIRKGVIENLNVLGSDGLIIDKFSFIGNCVHFYGRDVILGSTLRWISLLVLPGEVELINCSELLEKLVAARSLFVAFGTGPWNAMKRWNSVRSSSGDLEIAIVLDESEGERIGYHSGSDERIGTLVELWPNCENRPLFGTILYLASEAWQMPLAGLLNQDNWRHSGSQLSGRLSRTD